MKTKIATLLLITTTYFAYTSARVDEQKSLPLSQSVSGARATENKCTQVELEYTNKVGDDLVRISVQENAYEQVHSSLLLLNEILNNRLVSHGVKVALFEVVEKHLKTTVNKQVDNERKLFDMPTKSLTGMTKCSPPGDSAMNVEVVGNVNATSEEFQEMLANLSIVGTRLKQAKKVSNAISIGKIVVISFLAALAGCGIAFGGFHVYKLLRSDQDGQEGQGPQNPGGSGGYEYPQGVVHYNGQPGGYPHNFTGNQWHAGSVPYAQPVHKPKPNLSAKPKKPKS